MPAQRGRRKGRGRPIRVPLVAGRQQATHEPRRWRAYSTGWIGVVGQSSSRAPRTAASSVNRWAGSVAE